MSKNLEVFADFKEILVAKYKIINETIRFNANVIYKWDNGKKESDEFLDVYLYLSTMTYGDIQIFDGDIITAENVHTKIESKFSNPVLKLSANNSLVITGTSGKIGNYSIVIIPSGQ
jgi:hypothetical protein